MVAFIIPATKNIIIKSKVKGNQDPQKVSLPFFEVKKNGECKPDCIQKLESHSYQNYIKICLSAIHQAINQYFMATY